jgi:hypothetical protein
MQAVNSAILKVYTDLEVFFFSILLRNSLSTFFRLSFWQMVFSFVCIHLFYFIQIVLYFRLFPNVLIKFYCDYHT